MARAATAAVRLLTGEREPVRLATTADLPTVLVDGVKWFLGLKTIDGVLTRGGDRVLVKDQADATLNGIYTASEGYWYRAADARTSRTMQKGTTVHVQQGTANAGLYYGFQTFEPVIGTDNIVLALVIGDMTGFAPKASPAFTGTPTAPTAAPGTNTTQLSTTAFVKAAVDTAVQAAIDLIRGGVVSAFDTLSEIVASMVRKDADTALTAGYTATPVADGTKSSGSYKPSPAGGNYRQITSNGAFTFNAPDASGCYNLTVDITNGASVGTVTFSGFATGHPKGASLTTTNTNKFKIHISKTDIGVTANIEALQ